MFSFINHLRWLFSPQDKRKFIFIAMLMAFSAILELAGIGILLGAATVFLASDTPAGIKAAQILSFCMPGIAAKYQVAWAIIAIGLLLMLKNLFALLVINIQAKFIFAKRNELAKRLFKGFLYADYESFSQLYPEYCFGSFFRLNDIGNVILLPTMQVIADVMMIAVLSCAAVIMFPAITLAGTFFMVLTAFAISFFSRRANKKFSEDMFKHTLEENRFCQAGISGEKTIKCAVKEEYFLDRFAGEYKKKNDFACKLYTLGQLPRLSLESASIILAAVVFAVMVFMDAEKSRIMFIFAILTAVISRILPALSRCHYNLTLIRQSLPLLESTTDILRDLPQELRTDGTAGDAGETISFNNISFAYKGGQKIFDNFNLTIEPETSLAIAGKSGRGKSTLVDLLLGLLKPETGNITAGNIDISGNLPAWRKQIGIVPQNIFLLEGSVAENIAFGENDIDLKRVEKALQDAGLKEFSPDMRLTAQGNLSGGQRQRIGIARAFYKQAKLLILDEATSALDAETENDLCNVLKELHGKLTIIVISHRESPLEACDRKIVL